MAPELAVLLSLIAVAGCQLLPENNCPNYFQYVNAYQAEITVPAFKEGPNWISISFSTRGTQQDPVVGALFPYPDENALLLSTKKAFSIFRINFRPNPTSGVPKLTELVYNNQLICSANRYGIPYTDFTRFYELNISGPVEPLISKGFNPFPKNNFGGNNNNFPGQSEFFTPSNNFDNWPDFTRSWQTQTQTPNRIPSKSSRINNPSPTPPETIWEIVPSVPVPISGTPQITNTRLQPTPPPTPVRTPPPFTPVRTPPPFTPVQRQPPQPPPPIATNPPIQAPPPDRFNPRSPSATVVCGREGSLSPYIVRGKEFPRGQYPWLSAVYHKEGRSLAFKCGGSLVSASIVISAAHCVYRMTEDRVVIGLGRYDLDDYGEDGAEMHNVMRLLWHPEFNTRQLSDADIALITIERPVIFNDIISPICTWTAEASSTEASSGFIAGWGSDNMGGNSRTQYPRVVEAEIASATNCASNWRTSVVTDRSLCAGNRDGSGPCLGDSGGGLMVKQGDRWLLRGIVSAGERGTTNGACQLNQYVLYCDLSKHIDWINDNIR
ncbi:spermosin [Drosophila ficusphila]|uniref:spermosin n=1 Tax=Drosophila ficusphila TaxID=30025 RepID=UPI0007E68AEF|nr:spermosin [Drosophila ficusphila]